MFEQQLLEKGITTLPVNKNSISTTMSDGANNGTEASGGVTPGSSSGNGSGSSRRARGRGGGHVENAVRFSGQIPELKGFVYDATTGSTSRQDLWATVTEAIGEYVAVHYTDAGDYRTGLPDLSLPTLEEPALPTADASTVAIKIWDCLLYTSPSPRD